MICIQAGVDRYRGYNASVAGLTPGALMPKALMAEHDPPTADDGLPRSYASPDHHM